MTMPAWTYSRLEKFETCPKQFYHLKVAKDTHEPPTVHTEWGKEVHTAFENWTLNNTPLPEGMTQWQSIANKVTNLPGKKKPEFQLALTDSFQPADWDSAWTRGIADLLILSGDTAAVLDYKTGKRKPSEQLKLYAAYAFAYYPNLKYVDTGFVWLKEQKITSERVTREELPLVWQEFLPRVAKLRSAYERDSWPARPSGLCRGWCPVKSCDHYRSK
jgi:PD-(D/E)XK nuclease superfamily